MAEPQKPHVVIADINQVYHWTSVPSLQRLYNENKDKSKFPFQKDIGETTMIARSFPVLKGIKGFFAWSNSVGGMGASKNEMYANLENPALLRFSLKKNLKVLMLGSKELGKIALTEKDLKDVDVIYHTRQYAFHEYIVINPKAILSVTSDPKLLKPDIARDLKLFNGKAMSNESSENLYVTGDLYNNFGNVANEFETLLKPLISQFLENKVTAKLFH